MQLEMKRLDELLEADYNPRVKLKPGMAEYERLKRSLLEFDLVQPLVWNRRSGRLVGGHQRLQVLRELGVEDVNVVVVDLPEEREKALNVALNNERVGGKWDTGKLQELLEDLIELPDFDETLTGFSEEEMRDLVLNPMWEPEEIVVHCHECVQLTCDVREEDWEGFRQAFDVLLERFDVEVHVRGV